MESCEISAKSKKFKLFYSGINEKLDKYVLCYPTVGVLAVEATGCVDIEQQLLLTITV